MKIRSIIDSEINKCLSLGNDENSSFVKDLLPWFNEGRARSEWSFVVEDNNQYLGRIIYGVFKEEPTELKIWNIYLSETKYGYSYLLERLLKESINQMKPKGFNTIEYHLYSDDNKLFKEYKKVFTMLGFKVTQQKQSFVVSEDNLKQLDSRLRYKSIEDIGEEEFINAIQVVSENTLDKDDLNCIVEYGPREAAIQYHNILKNIDFNKEWWKVAYINEDDFVGLIVPQKFNDDMGAINYIGVSPEKRGNGYVNDLLYEGTRILFDNNIKEIIADIDMNNYPIEVALKRLGYKDRNRMEVVKLIL